MKAAADRLAVIDWHEISASLDGRGYATTPPLLTAAECCALAALYAREDVFRSRVIMQRHSFGRGEYKYLRYPLPSGVEELRQAVYPHLALFANCWRERLHEEGGFPPSLDTYLAQCHAAGQQRPTPLLLKYEAGDYNCLHQDLHGDLVFPLQLTVLLSAPEEDFHRRRIPAGRAQAASAVERRGRTATARRGRHFPGPPSAGRRHPRPLSGHDAPRRQSPALRPALYARHHLPRCRVRVGGQGVRPSATALRILPSRPARRSSPPATCIEGQVDDQLPDLALGDAVADGAFEVAMELPLATECHECRHGDQAAVALRQAGAFPDLAIYDLLRKLDELGAIGRTCSRADDGGEAAISVSVAVVV
jgi:hypothetical protein